jgi:hypothetical protein
MSTPEPSGTGPARKAGIPRHLAFALAPFLFLVAHGVLPWAISLLGPWCVWRDGSPAVWNLLGLVPVAIGVVDLSSSVGVGCR